MTHITINAPESLSGKPLTSYKVRELFEAAKKTGAVKTFHEQLLKSSIVLPENEAPKRSPELEARLERLRNEAENAEYRRMTENITSRAPN